MYILATNDDGIQCDGILRLLEMFRGEGHHVLAVVPDRNRSGASHSITFGASLPLVRIGDDMYIYGGSPVDCILVALTPGGLSYRPDMIVSGINAGPNLGTDILYSGTAAAARQGSLYDIPSIAFSVYGDAPYCFEEAARWSAAHLEELSRLWRLDTFINVNYPNTSRLSDYVVAYPLPRIYEDVICMEETADGSKICCMKDGDVTVKRRARKPARVPFDMSDWDAVLDQKVSVSIICNQPQAAAADCITSPDA